MSTAKVYQTRARAASALRAMAKFRAPSSVPINIDSYDIRSAEDGDGFVIVELEGAVKINTPVPEFAETAMPEFTEPESSEGSPVTFAPAETLASVEHIPTKPKRDHRPTRPWEPGQLLSVPKKFQEPGFRYRAVWKTKPGNMEKKISEGWEIDYNLGRKMTAEYPHLAKPRMQDGSQLDGTYQVREMIFMRIPERLAQERDAYYARKTTPTVAKKELQKDMASTGVKSYGEIEEKHG